MSDSELSTPADIPDDAVIERHLRRVVHEALARNEEITANLARTRTETQLGLEAGFLKNIGDWKQKSKTVINAAVEDPPSPEKRSKAVPKPKPKAATGTKRKSEDVRSNSKRRKKAAIVESADEEEEEESSPIITGEEAHLNASATDGDRGSATKMDEDNDQSDPPQDKEDTNDHKVIGKQDDVDESELSSVIDDPPPKKQRQRKAISTKAKPKPKPKSSAATESKSNGKALSADEEEIKRLQGWLVKCGVRKLWHRELASYATSQDRIRHLKGMLTEVGMTGRYSAEKAKQIKERRELAAELEAAQEFNDQWGHSGSEDDGENKNMSRPRRAAPKGLVDFGDSGDESD